MIASLKMHTKPYISVVMPCLNEEKAIGKCISDAKVGLSKLEKLGHKGEIIVVDNNSTDNSASIAEKMGVRVIFEKKRGYGAALKQGIKNSRGEYIIIGDCDNTYDFRQIKSFVGLLEKGADLVLGSRFKGTIKRGAMNFSHRYIGNPLLTFILNLSFASKISDVQTGMRAFSKACYKRLNLKSGGMEFASEMIIKAVYRKLKIKEVPVNYYPRLGISKLSPLSDAWRHIKFIILYSPTYALILPGFIFFILGITVGILLAREGRILFNHFFDIHTMGMGFLLSNVGLNIMLLGLFARLYTQELLGLPSRFLTNNLLKNLSVERLLVLGSFLLLIGLVVLGNVLVVWVQNGFGELSKIRQVIIGANIVGFGLQIIFSSFLFGLLSDEV